MSILGEDCILAELIGEDAGRQLSSNGGSQHAVYVASYLGYETTLTV